MAELITLAYFDAEARQYHIYHPDRSAVDGKMHYHDYFQVCFVTQGRLIHYQEGTHITLKKGDAFVIPPGFLHSLHFDAPNTQAMSLAFLDTMFHAGFNKSPVYAFLTDLQTDIPSKGVQLRLRPDPRQQESLQALLSILIREQNVNNPPALSAAPSLISSVLFLLAQCYYQNTKDRKHPPTGNDPLLQCIRYIDLHFRQPLSLDALTRQFGISRSAFCAAFPQYAGMPLGQYIAQKRIREAQLLIRSHPELPLSQIGTRVGYEDSSTFYRNFKKFTGISPADYRATQSYSNSDYLL